MQQQKILQKLAILGKVSKSMQKSQESTEKGIGKHFDIPGE